MRERKKTFSRNIRRRRLPPSHEASTVAKAMADKMADKMADRIADKNGE